MKSKALFLNIVLLTLSLLPLHASADFTRNVKISPDGSFTLDGRYRFSLIRYDLKWRPIRQVRVKPDHGYPRSEETQFSLRGEFSRFRISEIIRMQQKTTARFRWETSLTAEKETIPCRLLFLGTDLPLNRKIELRIDGKPVTMPPDCRKKNVFSGQARLVEVKDPHGVFTVAGNFYLYCTGKFLQGEDEYYQLRFLPAEQHPEQVKKWHLSLDFQYEFARNDLKSIPLDLSGIFNRSFRDDSAVPGWTGQGKDMDLRSLQTGEHNFYSVRINTLSPEQNGGKSCLILGQTFEPKSAEVDFARLPTGMTYLYLFHASAWTPVNSKPVGFLVLRYADGRSEKIAVAAGRDCGNWYRPAGESNAHLVWTGKVPSAEVGLYLSAFRLKGELAGLKFLPASGNTLWMIAGASLADGLARFPVEEEFVVRQGPDWLPIHFSGTTAEGSPLDFSIFRERPAGKYGHIIADANGHFVFEKAPAKRIRLLGPNLVGSANFPDRPETEQFIRNAERLGYNTVRLHHFEEGILKRNAADSLSIDPGQLKKFHFLIARLKEHGFYVCLDLYASRKLKAGDQIPEFDNTGEFSMKNLIPVSPAAMRNWKTFAREILTAKNPYTGLTLAEDPVLYSVNLVNENALIGVWNSGRTSLGARKIYLQKFEEYLQAGQLPPDGKQLTRNGIFIEFLNALQSRCIQEQMRFLKEEIGLKALITDLNNYIPFTLTGLRSGLDHVDNHLYWDHPQFPGKRWGIPFVFHNRSAISVDAAMPREIMATRVFGKPFTVTEFNFCVPNTWRVECPALFGGYAGLQDWDGLYRFAWSHGINGMRSSNRPLNHFDIANNIQAQMVERILYMLFIRGDVKAAADAYAFTFSPEQLRSLKGNSRAGDYPARFQKLGLFDRIGSLTEQQQIPGVKKVHPLREGWDQELSRKARQALDSLRETGSITSSTGEITLNRMDKSLRVITLRSEVLTGSGTQKGAVIASAKLSNFQTVALMSLDGKSLTESERLLLIQLTDLSNNGLRFEDKSRRVLLSWGALPQMLERGTAEITLHLPHPMKIRPLELDGTVSQKELPAEFSNGKLRFHIATDFLPGGTLASLLIRKKNKATGR